jgi:4-carboxymuconolactone decarboxylase
MDLSKDPDPRFQAGLKIRRDVLGTKHVDRSLANIDAFAAPLQKYVTENCWGEVWGRPGLERKTRSMLNLSMLSALNRMHEFKVHVRGALQNGVTREEIQEILLQVAVYCGAPASLESTRAAQEVFHEIDTQKA